MTRTATTQPLDCPLPGTSLADLKRNIPSICLHPLPQDNTTSAPWLQGRLQWTFAFRRENTQLTFLEHAQMSCGREKHHHLKLASANTNTNHKYSHADMTGGRSNQSIVPWRIAILTLFNPVDFTLA